MKHLVKDLSMFREQSICLCGIFYAEVEVEDDIFNFFA